MHLFETSLWCALALVLVASSNQHQRATTASKWPNASNRSTFDTGWQIGLANRSSSVWLAKLAAHFPHSQHSQLSVVNTSATKSDAKLVPESSRSTSPPPTNTASVITSASHRERRSSGTKPSTDVSVSDHHSSGTNCFDVQCNGHRSDANLNSDSNSNQTTTTATNEPDWENPNIFDLDVIASNFNQNNHHNNYTTSDGSGAAKHNYRINYRKSNQYHRQQPQSHNSSPTQHHQNQHLLEQQQQVKLKLGPLIGRSVHVGDVLTFSNLAGHLSVPKPLVTNSSQRNTSQLASSSLSDNRQKSSLLVSSSSNVTAASAVHLSSPSLSATLIDAANVSNQTAEGAHDGNYRRHNDLFNLNTSNIFTGRPFTATPSRLVESGSSSKDDFSYLACAGAADCSENATLTVNHIKQRHRHNSTLERQGEINFDANTRLGEESGSSEDDSVNSQCRQNGDPRAPLCRVGLLADEDGKNDEAYYSASNASRTHGGHSLSDNMHRHNNNQTDSHPLDNQLHANNSNTESHQNLDKNYTQFQGKDISTHADTVNTTEAAPDKDHQVTTKPFASTAVTRTAVTFDQSLIKFRSTNLVASARETPEANLQSKPSQSSYLVPERKPTTTNTTTPTTATSASSRVVGVQPNRLSICANFSKSSFATQLTVPESAAQVSESVNNETEQSPTKTAVKTSDDRSTKSGHSEHRTSQFMTLSHGGNATTTPTAMSKDTLNVSNLANRNQQANWLNSTTYDILNSLSPTVTNNGNTTIVRSPDSGLVAADVALVMSGIPKSANEHNLDLSLAKASKNRSAKSSTTLPNKAFAANVTEEYNLKNVSALGTRFSLDTANSSSDGNSNNSDSNSNSNSHIYYDDDDDHKQFNLAFVSTEIVANCNTSKEDCPEKVSSLAVHQDNNVDADATRGEDNWYSGTKQTDEIGFINRHDSTTMTSLFPSQNTLYPQSHQLRPNQTVSTSAFNGTIVKASLVNRAHISEHRPEPMSASASNKLNKVSTTNLEDSNWQFKTRPKMGHILTHSMESQIRASDTLGQVTNRPHCAAQVDSNHIAWSVTNVGVLALQPCPPAYTGTVYRPCFASGVWGQTDLTNCRLNALKELHQLVRQHVHKHLIDGLLGLTSELEHLLQSTTTSTTITAPDNTPMYSSLDRFDAIETLNSILLHSKIKIRIEKFDTDHDRKTINFIQSIVSISDQLMGLSHGSPISSTKPSKQILYVGQLVETILGLGSLMQNFLRALILSCQNGSIKNLPAQLILPNTKHLEIRLSFYRQDDQKLITTLLSTPRSGSQVGASAESILGAGQSVSSIVFPQTANKNKLVIKFQDSSALGVGISDIWLTDLAQLLNCDNVRVLSDLLYVSIVPAVSIEVNFEEAPKFEVEFSIHHSGRQSMANGQLFREDSNLTSDNDFKQNQLNEENSDSVNDSVTRMEIGCGRLTMKAKHAKWTRTGCQTVNLNQTHLRCACNEMGIIGAIQIPQPDKRKEFQLEVPRSTSFLANSNMVIQRHYHLRQYSTSSARSHRLSYDISLYISLSLSVAFFLATLCIQYRLRHYETRETFFIIRNLVISLLLIQLTFLFGTTFHMDLFWIRVAQWSSSMENVYFHKIKHILCLAVPIFLHFIHLASLFWMLSYSILFYQRFWRPLKLDNVNPTGDYAFDSSVDQKSENIINKIQTDPKQVSKQLYTSGEKYRKRYLKHIKNLTKSKNSSHTKLGLAGSIVRLVVAFLWKHLVSFPKHFIAKMTFRNYRAQKMDQNIPLEIKAKSQCLQPASNRNLNAQDFHSDAQFHIEPGTSCQKAFCRWNFKSGVTKPITWKSAWKCQHYLCLSLGLPFVFVLISYLFNKKGYETKRYCWMSIEGGIQYSFILPVLLLITTNTCLMLLVLKRYFERKSLIHKSQIDQIRPSLRSCIILLPFFSFNWFLSVLSLETLTTSPFELIFALTNCMHSFLVFYFHCFQRYRHIYYFPNVLQSTAWKQIIGFSKKFFKFCPQLSTQHHTEANLLVSDSVPHRQMTADSDKGCHQCVNGLSPRRKQSSHSANIANAKVQGQTTNDLPSLDLVSSMDCDCCCNHCSDQYLLSSANLQTSFVNEMSMANFPSSSTKEPTIETYNCEKLNKLKPNINTFYTCNCYNSQNCFEDLSHIYFNSSDFSQISKCTQNVKSNVNNDKINLCNSYTNFYPNYKDLDKLNTSDATGYHIDYDQAHKFGMFSKKLNNKDYQLEEESNQYVSFLNEEDEDVVIIELEEDGDENSDDATEEEVDDDEVDDDDDDDEDCEDGVINLNNYLN